MKARLFDRIDVQASHAPTSLAVICNGRAVTYSELRALVGTAADELHNHGVRPGDVIAIQIADPLRTWFTTLAVMHCGAVPCLLPVGIAEHSLLPDYVMADGSSKGIAAYVGVPRLAPPSGNLHGQGKMPATKASDADVAQIILSSGTTGPAKAVPLTWATIEQRTALRDRYFPIDGPVISLMQPSTAGGLQTCLTALMHGLTVDLSTDIAALVDAVGDPAMQTIIGSPSQLATLIKAMDVAGLRAPHIRACLLMGGAVSPHLQEAAVRVLGGSVLALYGSTELGACATYLAAGDMRAMPLLAGVQAQAVNDAGDILPDGMDGLLRLKAPGMADGYFRSPAATDVAFKAGWFYPGDTGSVQAGKLYLSGRSDEIINIGGAKFNPAEIDAHIERLGLVSDAAAFKFIDSNGTETLMIAAITNSKSTYAQMKADIREAVRSFQCPVGFFRVDAIPRNAMGKPVRGMLADQIKTALHRAATANDTMQP